MFAFYNPQDEDSIYPYEYIAINNRFSVNRKAVLFIHEDTHRRWVRLITGLINSKFHTDSWLASNHPSDSSSITFTLINESVAHYTETHYFPNEEKPASNIQILKRLFGAYTNHMKEEFDNLLKLLYLIKTKTDYPFKKMNLIQIIHYTISVTESDLDNVDQFEGWENYRSSIYKKINSTPDYTWD